MPSSSSSSPPNLLVEMDLLELDHSEGYIVQTDKEHLGLMTPSYGMEQAAVLPCIGNQYQVEIPPMLTEKEHVNLGQDPTSGGGMLSHDCASRPALAIPIMWVHCTGSKNREPNLEDSMTSTGTAHPGMVNFISKKGKRINSKCIGSLPGNSSSSYPADCKGWEHSIRNDKRNLGLPWLQPEKDKEYIALPDSPLVFLTAAEQESFLLGLYIFGKNLILLKEFVGSKSIGAILSYYYGKFYRSDSHQRWSECKRSRSRKCVHGQRIFAGWRLQEFLSRILSGVSAEVETTMLEAVKKFNEDKARIFNDDRAAKASLMEFVFTLKVAVGMQVLVEAVGIGKGKQDLTGYALDPPKANQVNPVIPEVPTGKAFSTLSSGEIIKFLTGDFRLSKAKSNDLFWEAIWPRLLAKGWHSEQPKGLLSVGSNKALVFLVPGINKFSRRKLMKGNHYFDSIRDVLNKVASDPSLLELEDDGAKGNGDSAQDKDAKPDQNSPSYDQGHWYLQPKLPNCSSELVEFTVVDTSWPEGGKLFTVKELRNLPANLTRNSCLSSCSGEATNDYSRKPHDSNLMLIDDLREADRAVSADKNNMCISSMVMQSGNYDQATTKSKTGFLVNGHWYKDHFNGLSSSMLPLKCQFRRKARSSQPNGQASASKRQRFASCQFAQAGQQAKDFSEAHALKKDGLPCEFDAHKGSDRIYAQKGGQDESSEHIISGNNGYASIDTEMRSYQEKPPFPTIDLNVPPAPEFCDSDPIFSREAPQIQDDLNSQQWPNPPTRKQQLDDSQAMETKQCNELTKQQPAMNARRHSTRNRLPTTRALEAVADGLLNTSRREKATQYNMSSRPSRCARKTTAAAQLAKDNEFTGDTNHASMSEMSHTESEKKGTHARGTLASLA